MVGPVSKIGLNIQECIFFPARKTSNFLGGRNRFGTALFNPAITVIAPASHACKSDRIGGRAWMRGPDKLWRPESGGSGTHGPDARVGRQSSAEGRGVNRRVGGHHGWVCQCPDPTSGQRLSDPAKLPGRFRGFKGPNTF